MCYTDTRLCMLIVPAFIFMLTCVLTPYLWISISRIGIQIVLYKYRRLCVDEGNKSVACYSLL